MEFYKGTTVRFRARFLDERRASFDPEVVRLRIKDPAGTETVYSYPGDPEIVREGLGVYSSDVPLDRVGTYYLRFESDGEGRASSEVAVKVTSLAWS